MKKKILTALICVCMAAIMMAGCSKNDTGSNNGQPDTAVTATPSPTPASEEKTETPKEESKDEPVAEAPKGGMASPEALPAEAAYHFAFDGSDEGIANVIQTSDVGNNTGANLGVIESSTYTDKDGNEQKIAPQYANGPVGKALFLDGNYGLKLPVQALDTEKYTISFWLNADRLSTFGPTVQLGNDIGMSDATNKVTWINFTQSEWGSNSAKIFPVVWNRNSATGAWPWVYAADDSIHGKREWVMITLVATGDIYNYAEDGCDRNACQLYLNGELAFDASEGAYGGLATGIMSDANNFECFVGINYWDTIYKGFIDELYIYKEALTAGQVASLYLLGDPTVESVAEAAVIEEDTEPVPQVVTNINSSAIATVGTPTCDNGFWSSFSDAYEIKDGATTTIHFKNYGSGINNWDNYVLALTNTATTADKAPSADNYAGYVEYGVVRSDAWGWAFPNGQPAFCDYSWNWDNFISIMMDADITLKVTRNGGDIKIAGVVKDASGAEYTYNIESDTTASAGDPMYFFLTNERSYIEILSVE